MVCMGQTRIVDGSRRDRSPPPVTSPGRSLGTRRPALLQRLEPGAHLADEELRLLPGREMCAFIELVVVDQLGIRLLCPTPWGRVDLFRESAHGDRDFDAPHIEEAAGWKIMPGVPVEAC